MSEPAKDQISNTRTQSQAALLRESALSLSKHGNMTSANFPRDAEGRTYHVGAKPGEICNRVLTVGDPQRAATLSKFLDNPDDLFVRSGYRGFTIYTGTRKGVPVSIISIGMGIAMMDFLIRETVAVVTGTLLVTRFGTCGCITPTVPVGATCIATKGSRLVQRNPNAWMCDETDGKIEPYVVSKVAPADPELSKNLFTQMKEKLEGHTVLETMNASADSFYSSQARDDPNFDDKNGDLAKVLVDGGVSTLEMETFQLLHLAHTSKRNIRATAATVILAQRNSDQFLDNDTKSKLVLKGGEACLDALISTPLPEEEVMNTKDCVWKQDVAK